MVVFPDVEALYVKHLGALLSVPVSTRVPNPRPDSFVRLSRVGGGQRNLVMDAPMITFEAFALDDVAAHDLGAQVRAHVMDSRGEVVEGTQIYRIGEVGGLQSYPDPVSDSPRYQFTAQIFTRGTES